VKHTLRKELIDQGAHAATAILALAPLALFPCLGTGAWAGLVMGLVRELTEEGAITLAALKHCFTGPHSRQDLLSWAVAGAIVGQIAA
jgi:hypothetical protein